jgi:hypothetical protein
MKAKIEFGHTEAEINISMISLDMLYERVKRARKKALKLAKSQLDKMV